MTLSELASRYYRAFEEAERPDGSRYWKCRDSFHDADLHQLCREAHGAMLADDNRYRFIVDALALLADYDAEEAVQCIEADCYTHDLTAWLHSSIWRIGYLTETLESYAPKDGFQLLALAQSMERTEVFDSVLASLRCILAARNGEA